METISLIARGGCMQPIIKDGDRILVAKQKKFRTGDIIVYFNEHHKLIVHRYAKILGIEKTKGDNNIFFDAFVIKKPLGKVLVDEPFFKRIKMLFRLKTMLLNELLRGTF